MPSAHPSGLSPFKPLVSPGSGFWSQWQAGLNGPARRVVQSENLLPSDFAIRWNEYLKLEGNGRLEPTVQPPCFNSPPYRGKDGVAILPPSPGHQWLAYLEGSHLRAFSVIFSPDKLCDLEVQGRNFVLKFESTQNLDLRRERALAVDRLVMGEFRLGRLRIFSGVASLHSPEGERNRSPRIEQVVELSAKGKKVEILLQGGVKPIGEFELRKVKK